MIIRGTRLAHRANIASFDRIHFGFSIDSGRITVLLTNLRDAVLTRAHAISYQPNLLGHITDVCVAVQLSSSLVHDHIRQHDRVQTFLSLLSLGSCELQETGHQRHRYIAQTMWLRSCHAVFHILVAVRDRMKQFTNH